jgi:conjugal transfer pilus assembly protein TraK
MTPAMSATVSGTLAPTVVPLTNGGQANIAVSNTDPNLFMVPGDRITAINSLDGGLTNQEQTDSGGAILATVSKKPFTFIVETERGLNFSIRAVPRAGQAGLFSWSPNWPVLPARRSPGKSLHRMKASWYH